jgi:predicted porin
MKKVLSLAIAAALVAPAAAMADATIYGKVRQSLDIVSDERDEDAEVDEIQINDRTSRFGVKGSEDLGNGLSGVYKIEYGVRISTSDAEFSGDGSLSARNAFVGLAGGFGTFVIGRHDTPLKISTGSLDYFGDTIVDNNTDYTESFADRRADGTVAYISPSLGGFTAAVALVPGENSEADGIADAFSIAGMYSNSGIFASLAYEAGDQEIDTLSAGDVDLGDLSQTRVGLGYDGGAFKIGFAYEVMTIEDPADGDDIVDSASGMLNAAIKAGPGFVALKAFSYADDANEANDHTGGGIGYHYNMSKRTQRMVNAGTSTFDDQDGDVRIFGLQVNHSF